jgi:hypothetical protein
VVVRIVGQLRRAHLEGFGPFKKQVWQTEAFESELRPRESVTPTDHLTFRLFELPGRAVLEGVLNNTPCSFAEINYSGGQTSVEFSMRSVRNVELVGTAELSDFNGLNLVTGSSAA